MKQNYKKIIALVAMASLAGAMSTHASLVVNGGFEDLGTGNSFNTDGWNYFTSIPGWTPVGNSPELEVGLGSVYGVTGYDGLNVMELDSTANVMVDQGIIAGGSYQLSFLDALRAGISPSSGTFEVYWNNQLVASLAPTSSAMSLYSVNVTGNGGVNDLEFVGTGTSDSYGAIIDDISLVAAVPEPTTVIAGALLLLPFGISTIRILRKNRMA